MGKQGDRCREGCLSGGAGPHQPIAMISSNAYRFRRCPLGQAAANLQVPRYRQPSQPPGLVAVINSTSPLTPPPRRRGRPAAGRAQLLIGCDPLHHQLLPPAVQARPAWQPPARWREQLKGGALDAVLLSAAGLAHPCGSETGDPGSAAAPARPPAGDGITAIALGQRPLVLLHAIRQRQLMHHGSQGQRWQLLLPPAGEQPMLWRHLEQLALLPLRGCHADNPQGWLQRLQEGPYLLPAHRSLLAQTPWREAGLQMVPFPEPLIERLWLLMRCGDAQEMPLSSLAALLRERLLADQGQS